MKIREIVKATGGGLVSGGPETEIDPAAISTDSRTIGPGQFFLPLKGSSFDGEQFIGEAFDNGAIGALSCPRKRASIQALDSRWSLPRAWIPAFAGMTRGGNDSIFRIIPLPPDARSCP